MAYNTYEMGKRKTTEEFIVDAIKVHQDKYDYSKVEYINSNTKVCIICPEHGEFWQSPSKHINGQGCPKCGFIKSSDNKSSTNEEFIKRAKEIHKDKYEYSKTFYVNSNTKVVIICKKHGEFEQIPYHHLKGHGCPKCRNEMYSRKYTSNTEEFIKKAKEIHNNKYDYSKVKYQDWKTKVCIICPEHGEFWQTPNNHLHGFGCQSCGGKKKLTSEEFINKAKAIHCARYDYSQVKYVNAKSKVLINCKTHGVFRQTPNKHLKGEGCPLCNSSKLENSIRVLLKNNDIEYEEQKKFDWLGLQRLDFYLPDYNIAIECQGIQHFETIEHFGGKNGFNERKERDERKYRLCEENGIKILYYANCRYNSSYELITDEKELIKTIKCYV